MFVCGPKCHILIHSKYLQDISAKFKVAAESDYLVYKVEWLSSSDIEGKEDFRILSNNQFNHNFATDGIVTTFLTIIVTKDNANKFYWPRITFNTLAVVQPGALTTMASDGKILLLISGTVIGYYRKRN